MTGGTWGQALLKCGTLFLCLAAAAFAIPIQTEFVHVANVTEPYFPITSGSCAPTSEESDITQYVQTRQKRLSDGDIKKQITSGSYTADSLNADLYEWWVQRGLANQGLAIEQFSDLMQRAKEKAEKKDWLSVVLSWLGLFVGELEPLIKSAELIQTGLEAVKTEIETWKTAAEGESSGDFLECAMNWRGSLPTKQTKSLRMIDSLVNAVRNVQKKDRTEALLQAYDAATKLIARSQSFRMIFNSYYLAYLNSSVSLYSGHSGKQPYPFYYMFNAPNGNIQQALWTPTPGNLDACTIADYVFKLNSNCIRKDSPLTSPIANLGFKVQVMVNQGFGTGLQLDCADLALDHYEGCWIGGYWHGKGDSNCFTVAQQAKVFTTWPSSGVKAFCAGLTDSTFGGCNVNGYGQIPCTGPYIPVRNC